MLIGVKLAQLEGNVGIKIQGIFALLATAFTVSKSLPPPTPIMASC